MHIDIKKIDNWTQNNVFKVDALLACKNIYKIT
jgi:hypothetical protein